MLINFSMWSSLNMVFIISVMKAVSLLVPSYFIKSCNCKEIYYDDIELEDEQAASFFLNIVNSIESFFCMDACLRLPYVQVSRDMSSFLTPVGRAGGYQKMWYLSTLQL